jgi:hypothetical protein
MLGAVLFVEVLIETLNHIFLDCVGKSSVEFLPLTSQNFLFLY